MQGPNLLQATARGVYFGPVELRTFGQADEGLILHPHGRFRLEFDPGRHTAPVANHFFTDALGSVRTALDAGGGRVENHSFNPWGEKTPWLSATQTLPETKGWIGERYDEDAGLQYLNARYYDPKLGLFLQPDWFEVKQPGVGTNRYSYSFNDPVNKLDPNGNAWKHAGKLALNGGNIALTLEGVYSDVTVLTGEGYSFGDRAKAAASLATEVLPVSYRDVRAAYQTTRRGALKAMGYQTHHILPQSLRDHPAIRATGFDIESAKNKIELPSKRDAHPTRTVHNGRHNNDYTDSFLTRLDRIEQAVSSGQMTPAQGRAEIEKLVADARQGLRNGDINLNKSSRDNPPVRSERDTNDPNASRDDGPSDGPDDRDLKR